MKKIILIICILLLSGCRMYYINNSSLEEIINLNIKTNTELYNVNNKGYRYYLPMGFTVLSDEDYNQVLTSNYDKYYLFVDVVSYFYKNSVVEPKENDDFAYYSFKEKDKDGYLKIRKNNDYFFIELCYNYAIIEVEVEQKNIKYAVSRAISILNSIKYNDKIIEKHIGQNDIESSERKYEIPSPEEKNDDHILEYINNNENKNE